MGEGGASPKQNGITRTTCVISGDDVRARQKRTNLMIACNGASVVWLPGKLVVLKGVGRWPFVCCENIQHASTQPNAPQSFSRPVATTRH